MPGRARGERFHADQPGALIDAHPPVRSVVSDAYTLEPLSADHADAMFVVLSDPAIYEFENAPPESPEWLRQRYARLESRRSADGREQWLNWVIRLPDGQLAGYVQATVHADGRAAIAYELASAHWGRGLARRAVEAMIGELVAHHGVCALSATLKQANHRSLRLLERLGFAPASAAMHATCDALPDERVMIRDAVVVAVSPRTSSRRT